MDRSRMKLGDKVMIPAVVEKIEYTTMGEISYKVEPLTTWFDADEIEALKQTESEQYKKGFEDAKRAFLIEYARESESMRRRNAQLEVMLNVQKAISAEAVQGNAESATTTDCISRADTVNALCRECQLETKCGGADCHENWCTEVAVVMGMPSVSEEEVDYCNNCPYLPWGNDCISRQQAIEALTGWQTEPLDEDIVRTLESLPPVEDIGEVSDGYHTFNQLYHQRAVLFATIVNQNKDKAWKSWKHEDGKFCFDKGGEWFIVGIDTPEGSYTYHYEKKYWDLFDCEELDRGKHWDGHTEEDVTRLLSLPQVEPKPVMTEEVREAIMRLTMCAREECFMCKYEDSCGFDKKVGMATENMNTILKAFTERPKGAETMIVDGMEIEIDPVSYEVGYTHGQFSERPKGEWIKATGVAPPEFAGRYVCSNCSSYALMNMPYGSRQKLSPFCPNCGADMRGDKE